MLLLSKKIRKAKGAFSPQKLQHLCLFNKFLSAFGAGDTDFALAFRHSYSDPTARTTIIFVILAVLHTCGPVAEPAGYPVPGLKELGVFRLSLVNVLGKHSEKRNSHRQIADNSQQRHCKGTDYRNHHGKDHKCHAQLVSTISAPHKIPQPIHEKPLFFRISSSAIQRLPSDSRRFATAVSNYIEPDLRRKRPPCDQSGKAALHPQQLFQDTASAFSRIISRSHNKWNSFTEYLVAYHN